MGAAPSIRAGNESVTRPYRHAPFPGERHRVEYLFTLYEKLTAPLLPTTKPRRQR